MQLLVRVQNQTIAVQVAQGETSAAVRNRLRAMFGAELSFIAAGRIVDDLASCPSNIVLEGYVPVNGGGKDKKRKKKVHKTPKKIDHIHKKVKLACLKFYSVKGTTVDSLREYCPTCGAGVRLARHKNRLHCGRCGFAKKF